MCEQWECLNDLHGRARRLKGIHRFACPKEETKTGDIVCGKLTEDKIRLQIVIGQRKRELQKREPIINGKITRFSKMKSLKDITREDLAEVGGYLVIRQWLKNFESNFEEKLADNFDHRAAELASGKYRPVLCKGWIVVLRRRVFAITVWSEDRNNIFIIA